MSKIDNTPVPGQTLTLSNSLSFSKAAINHIQQYINCLSSIGLKNYYIVGGFAVNHWFYYYDNSISLDKFNDIDIIVSEEIFGLIKDSNKFTKLNDELIETVLKGNKFQIMPADNIAARLLSFDLSN